MSESVKVVFDGDGRKLREDIDKTQRKMGEVKTAAKGIGAEYEMMGRSWIKSAIGITAIVSALKAVYQKTKEIRAEQAEHSKRAGAATMATAPALAAAGVSPEDAAQISAQMAGAQDPDAARAQMAKMAEDAAKKRRPLNIDAARASALAAGSGLFTGDEIERIGQGRMRYDPAGRLSQMSPDARREYQIRERERLAAADRAQRDLGAEDQERERASARERWRKENPWASMITMDSGVDYIEEQKKFAGAGKRRAFNLAEFLGLQSSAPIKTVSADRAPQVHSSNDEAAQ